MNKKIVFSCILSLFVGSAFAQNKDTGKTNKDNGFTYVQLMPQYPGGNEAMKTFISNNIKYPSDAKRDNIQGRVIIKFVVDENGAIQNAVVVKGINASCDSEALRVVRLMPRWKPGMKDGKAVKVFYTIPLSFRLQNEPAQTK